MNARLEEAAQIATEYLASIENLPQEAQHLLAEIKHLDAKSEELTSMIATETKAHVRHPNLNSNGRTAPLPAAVGRMYDEVNALAAEKVALSARLTQRLERAMARLQHDLQRILELEADGDGDGDGLPPTQTFLAGVENAVRQIHDLRAAAQEVGLGSPPAAAAVASGKASSASGAPGPRVQKKRKADASAGGGKASNAVRVGPGRRATSQKTGPSPRGKHGRSQGTAAPAKGRRGHGASAGDEEEDEEKENDSEVGGDGNDGPYCYCGEGAWGEMIECENRDCANQWFHLSCAGLRPPLPKVLVWYCDDCKRDRRVSRKGTPAVSGSASRKGRKTQ